MSNVLGVVSPKNKKYFVEIVTELIQRYDNRELTRSQLLDTLTSWQVVIDHIRDIQDAPDKFRTGSNACSYVASLKLPQDIFNEWSGTNVEKDYVAFLDKIGWKVGTTGSTHTFRTTAKDAPVDPRFKVWTDIMNEIDKDSKFEKPLEFSDKKTNEEFRTEFARRWEKLNEKISLEDGSHIVFDRAAVILEGSLEKQREILAERTRDGYRNAMKAFMDEGAQDYLLTFDLEEKSIRPRTMTEKNFQEYLSKLSKINSEQWLRYYDNEDKKEKQRITKEPETK